MAASTGHQKNATITGHWVKHRVTSSVFVFWWILATKGNPFELLLHQIQRHFWGAKKYSNSPHYEEFLFEMYHIYTVGSSMSPKCNIAKFRLKVLVWMIPNPPIYLIKLTKFCGSGINKRWIIISTILFLQLSDDSEKLFVNSCVRSIIRNRLKYNVSLPQFFFPIEESFLRVAEYTLVQLQIWNWTKKWHITLLSEIKLGTK